MERFTNFFELHVGFPNTEESQQAALQFLDNIQKQSTGWSLSKVRQVYVTEGPEGPGCLDPHNVPGTLGSLVSRRVAKGEQSWSNTITTELFPACNAALATLSALGTEDARLEIEFPFACFSTSSAHGVYQREAWGAEPEVIEPDGTEMRPSPRLVFSGAERLEHVPRWEIHFVLEQINASAGQVVSIQDIPMLLTKYGVRIEQTIEYQSQAMREEGRSDFRLIATSYYETVDETKREAMRLYYDEPLSKDLFEMGYSLKLISEHIVGCFRVATPKLKRVSQNVKVAEVISA